MRFSLILFLLLINTWLKGQTFDSLCVFYAEKVNSMPNGNVTYYMDKLIKNDNECYEFEHYNIYETEPYIFEYYYSQNGQDRLNFKFTDSFITLFHDSSASVIDTLFRFDVTEGDTSNIFIFDGEANAYYYSGLYINVIIDSIRSINFNQLGVRDVYFYHHPAANALVNGGGLSYYWIKGLINGQIGLYDKANPMFGTLGKVTCFKIDSVYSEVLPDDFFECYQGCSVPTSYQKTKSSYKPFQYKININEQTLSIDLLNRNQSSVKILDMLGRIIYSNNMYKTKESITTCSWPSGVYTISINDSDSKNSRFILTRSE